MIRCVAFDFDNTLVASESAKRQAFFATVDHDPTLTQQLAELLAVRPTLDRFEVFARLADWSGRGHTAATAWVERFNTEVDAALLAADEIPGATAALQRLAGEQRAIAIISATPTEALQRAVAGRGWDGLVDDVLGRPTGKIGHLRYLMADRHYGAEEVVMVGDRIDDQRAAAAVGVRFVQIRWVVPDGAAIHAEDLPQAVAGQALPVLDDLTGLADLISSMDQEATS